MHEGHRTLIKFSLLDFSTLDLRRTINKIIFLLLFVQNNKSSKANWQ